MPLFTVAGISLAYGAREVLSNISASLDAGDRVGLVGPNGAGKTSLMRVIAGEERPTAGQVSLANGKKLGYVPQIPMITPGLTVREEVMSGIAHLNELEAAIEAAAHRLTDAGGDAAVAAASRAYEDVTHRFEAEGGYRFRAEAEQILAGLRLPERLWTQPAEGLSGGEKSRISLARVLLGRPDVLLLDEPTNHLDIAGITWLEGFLLRWPGSIVVVSHDRLFLDKVATEIWQLQNLRLTTFRGNYSAYVTQREEQLALQRDQFKRQREHIAREEALIRRYKTGQRARWALGRQKQLTHIERIEAPQEEARVKIGFGKASRTGRAALTLDSLVVNQPGEGGRELLRFPDRLEVERGARVAIVGANGTGKTTLLRTFTGERHPARGRVILGANGRPGYYRQGTEHLDDRRTVLEELLTTRNMPLQDARDFLARFLFRGERIEQPVGTLSGGERSRLALAKLAADDVNILLLDEPTNHLDIASREALETVLEGYKGTILFVTHDRALIYDLASESWLIDNGRVTVFEGGVIEMPAPAERVERERPAAQPRMRNTEIKALAQRRRDVERLEAQVEAAEQRLALLMQQLQEASAHHDAATTGEVGSAYAEAEQQLHALMETWETAAKAVEVAAGGVPQHR
jgi:ATP-binding cassette subfamily F protein 3